MTITQTNNILYFESNIVPGFSYVHYLTLVNLEAEELLQAVITTSESSYTLTSDSYYKVTEIQLPTTPGSGYYISGDQVFDSGDQEVSLEDLLAVDVSGTNIVREDLDLVSVYFLNEYYINLLKNKYLKNICSCTCVSKIDKVLIDSLTMGIMLIESLVKNNKYNESNRIIYQLSTCSNLVTTSTCNCNG